MAVAFVIFGVVWVVLGGVSFFLGSAYGLDKAEVRRNLSNLINYSYLSKKNWTMLAMEFLASLFWFPIGHPIIGASVGFAALVIFV
jgi:hypothetical protein